MPVPKLIDEHPTDAYAAATVRADNNNNTTGSSLKHTASLLREALEMSVTSGRVPLIEAYLFDMAAAAACTGTMRSMPGCGSW